MGTNGKVKVFRKPVFIRDGAEFVMKCDSFTGDSHVRACELGECANNACESVSLTFTGYTEALPLHGTEGWVDRKCQFCGLSAWEDGCCVTCGIPSRVNGMCPIVYLKKES